MLLRLFLAALLLGALPVATISPVRANPGDATALGPSIIAPANGMLRSALVDEKVSASKPSAAAEIALPRGWSYTLDASIAYPLNTTGFNNVKLPGGVDAIVNYGFSRRVRATLGYYELQEYPAAFDTGKVPLFLQGISPPIGMVDLHDSQLDVTVKNNIIVAGLQSLFIIGHKLPVVITPSYISRTGTLGGRGDELLIDVDGFPKSVHLRTFQQQLIAVTVPFLSTPKMFGTYTIAPEWLVQRSAANTDNKAQLFQLLSLEYRPNPRTKLTFQPSLLQNYTPSDRYSAHIPTQIYAGSYKTSPASFFQVVFSNGTPVNPPDKKLGIVSLTCQKLPCTTDQIVPKLGGLKASQVQLMFGIGSPAVIPL